LIHNYLALNPGQKKKTPPHVKITKANSTVAMLKENAFLMENKSVPSRLADDAVGSTEDDVVAPGPVVVVGRCVDDDEGIVLISVCAVGVA
jgi:hypothetical protein